MRIKWLRVFALLLIISGFYLMFQENKLSLPNLLTANQVNTQTLKDKSSNTDNDSIIKEDVLSEREKNEKPLVEFTITEHSVNKQTFDDFLILYVNNYALLENVNSSVIEEKDLFGIGNILSLPSYNNYYYEPLSGNKILTLHLTLRTVNDSVSYTLNDWNNLQLIVNNNTFYPSKKLVDFPLHLTPTNVRNNDVSGLVFFEIPKRFKSGFNLVFFFEKSKKTDIISLK